LNAGKRFKPSQWFEPIFRNDRMIEVTFIEGGAIKYFFWHIRAKLEACVTLGTH
jgi:hypothetical protein